jgi:hypothetical protein
MFLPEGRGVNIFWIDMQSPCIQPHGVGILWRLSLLRGKLREVMALNSIEGFVNDRRY